MQNQKYTEEAQAGWVTSLLYISRTNISKVHVTKGDPFVVSLFLCFAYSIPSVLVLTTLKSRTFLQNLVVESIPLTTEVIAATLRDRVSCHFTLGFKPCGGGLQDKWTSGLKALFTIIGNRSLIPLD